MYIVQSVVDSATFHHIETPSIFKLWLEASVGWSVCPSVCLYVEKILDDLAFLGKL